MKEFIADSLNNSDFGSVLIISIIEGMAGNYLL
jgi:hypothetical protein